MAQPISAVDVQKQLAGLESWLRAAEASAGITDEVIDTELIPARIRDFETETKWRVNEVQVVQNPDGTYDTDGNKPWIQDSPHHYYVSQGPEFLVTTLRHRPVQTLQRVRVMLGPQQNVLTLPTAWYRLDQRMGKFWMVPITGSAAIGSAVATWGYLIGLANREYIPQGLAFDYVAGLPDGWETDDTLLYEYGHIKRCLAEWCALGLLEQISELYGAGMLGKSISVDGHSQQQQYSRFQQRREMLENSTSWQMNKLRDQEVPVEMAFV